MGVKGVRRKVRGEGEKGRMFIAFVATECEDRVVQKEDERGWVWVSGFLNGENTLVE